MKTLLNLVRWELEEYTSVYVLAFLIASAIIAVLAQSLAVRAPENVYINLYYESSTVLLFLTFSAAAFYARSFAGSAGRGEVKMLLSYPIMRWQIFISKFVTNFLVIFGVYGTVYSLHMYLDALSPFEPMFYLSLFGFLLQLMLSCSISVAISLATKNEIMSFLSTVLLLFGLDSVAGGLNVLSGQGRFMFLFGYFGKLTHIYPPFGTNFIVGLNDVGMAIAIPVSIFVFLIVLSFTYFVRIMEVD